MTRKAHVFEPGQRFGMLVVSHQSTRYGLRAWACDCDCGGTVTLLASQLVRGTRPHCGCKFEDRSVPKEIQKLRGIWHAMKSRCLNKDDAAYDEYGGRGISICQRWMTFENFVADVGPRPSPEHSIDRYPDNNGNYEPGNVRWATVAEQNRNQRRTRFVTAFGETKCMRDWENDPRCPVTESAIRTRMEKGWTAELAISTPGYARTAAKVRQKVVRRAYHRKAVETGMPAGATA